MSSSSSSSSSLLNVWGRGISLNDQLTPKASAQASTSMEIDPFDNLKHPSFPSPSPPPPFSSSNNPNQNQNQNQNHHKHDNNNNSNNKNNTNSSHHHHDPRSTPVSLATTATITHPSSSSSSSSSSITSSAHAHHPNSVNPASSTPLHQSHHMIDDPDLRTPMPDHQPHPAYFTPLNPSSTDSPNRAHQPSHSPLRHQSQPQPQQSTPTHSMAADALKALGTHHHPPPFRFTNKPITRSQQKNSSIHPPTTTSSSSNNNNNNTTTTTVSSSESLSNLIKNNTNPPKLPPSTATSSPSASSSSAASAPPNPAPLSPSTTSATSTKNSLTLPPQGLLSVKIIQASSLKFASSQSRPYVFAQFDNNEFASREPIGEEEEESKGVPTSTTAAVTNNNNNNNNNPNSKLETAPTSTIINHSKKNSSTSIHPSPSSLNQQTVQTNSTNKKNNDDGLTDLSNLHSSANNRLYCLSGRNPIWKQEVDFDVTSPKPSHNGEQILYISVYDRSIGDTYQDPDPKFIGSRPNLPIPGIEGVEMFLGETEIKLDLNGLKKLGGWSDRWYRLTMKTAESTNLVDSGKIRIQLKYHDRKSKNSLDVSDFEFLKMIGRGTFGRVFQVRKKDTRRIYAMKVLSKKEVIDKKEVQHTIGERNILQQSSNCPFLLGLKFSFQSPGELFLVMDYKSGGELFHHLQKEGRFTEERARFYTAEIVLALEHLHKYNIVYRDLKPENILLDATGHIVLCDFGLSKPNLNPDELTTTFCGTTEYLAPEVLLDDHGYSKLVDFWSLGVLLFEMCCGWSPFYAEDNQQMYKNICFGKIKFPRGVIGDDGKQFVKGLLNRNPKHRLGSQNDTEDLKKHEFFKTIDWKLLAARKIIPSFKPHIDSDESVSNFDKEFTQLNIEDHLPMTIQDRRRLQNDLSNHPSSSVHSTAYFNFDENDRSDDWVKQTSSYVNSSGLISAAMGHHHHHKTTKQNLLYSPHITGSTNSTKNESNTDTISIPTTDSASTNATRTSLEDSRPNATITQAIPTTTTKLNLNSNNSNLASKELNVDSKPPKGSTIPTPTTNIDSNLNPTTTANNNNINNNASIDDQFDHSLSMSSLASSKPLIIDRRNDDQDQFLGFSYHGESELMNSISSLSSSTYSSNDNSPDSPTFA